MGASIGVELHSRPGEGPEAVLRGQGLFSCRSICKKNWAAGITGYSAVIRFLANRTKPRVGSVVWQDGDCEGGVGWFK